MSKYIALKATVKGRGIPPEMFLDELIAWGRIAPVEIFTPNNDSEDVFIRLAPLLGREKNTLLPNLPVWNSSTHRRAALLELLRCLAGFESSWNWNEGVDKTNATSQRLITGRETGIFQVSYDSLALDDVAGTGDDLHECVRKYCDGTLDIHLFLDRMKFNHMFALEYGARLLRNSFYWDGPIKRHEIDSSLSRAAVAEFQALLA